MMPRLHITAGQRFGRLVAVREGGKLGNGKIAWVCRCDCGRVVSATSSSLHLGKKKSCGCLRAIRGREMNRTHGLSRSPTYISWQNMWTRCSNPSYRQYADYGGRGVTICDRWRLFENFLDDMGARPEGKTIDRIDPFGNYEPQNCRWATRAEQNRNTRGQWAIARMRGDK